MVEIEREDVYKPYYTESSPIVRAMIGCLDLEDGVSVLEPCGGSGVFVDAILRSSYDVGEIDVYDVDPEAISLLREKYAEQDSVSIIDSDFLTDSDLSLKANYGGAYDRIIANPPYGAWQEPERREMLKEMYDGMYVKETYSLFLHRGLTLLNELGTLVYIVPDTYLHLHSHQELRTNIFTNFEVNVIKLFPSSFFPEVDFGYSNLSIISLTKPAGKCDSSNTFGVERNFGSVEDLADRPQEVHYFTQEDILSNVDSALFVTDTPSLTNLINSHTPTLGDIAECVTGFYSGSNKDHLYVKSKEVPYGSSYPVADQQKVVDEPNKVEGIVDGLEGDSYLVPIVKGGQEEYVKETEWYADWRKAAIKEYKSSSKARFQNSDYYFRNDGIGVPMVKSSSISAALLDGRLFDQSIVGVFPHDEDLKHFILAFFSTRVASKVLSIINPTANNSANYLKKIPIVIPEKGVTETIKSKTKSIVEIKKRNGDISHIQSEVENIFADLYPVE